MSSYLSAGIFGTYGPFHCLTPSRSNTTASTSTRSSSSPSPHSRPSSPTSSLSSIRSINTVLLSRRRKSPRRMASTSSVLPLSVAEPNDFLRMNDGIYGDCSRSSRSSSLRRANKRADGPPEIVGLMEPRPREVVGWGIGEVLDGRRL